MKAVPIFSKNAVFYLWNFWPPFFGAGIVLDKFSKDLSYVKMKLKKRPWTKNLIGTQYGGSMFSMVDPIYMTMLTFRLGKNYRVIDKSASIHFKKLGKTTLTAEFKISDSDLEDIISKLNSLEKFDWEKEVDIYDLDNEVVATVKKVISIKKRI